MPAANIIETISFSHSIIAISPASPSGPKTVSIAANTKINQTGSRCASGIQTATTSPAALDIGSLGGGTLGRFAIKNLDPTNILTLLTATGGTDIISLLPGEMAQGRFAAAITAPAIESEASTVNCEYCIAEA